MNDCYGVDPATPRDVRDLAVLFRLFGMSEGRFIVDFPPDWASSVRQHLASLANPLDKKKIVELWLRNAKGAVLPLPSHAKFDGNAPWAANAAKTNLQVRRLVGPPGSPATVTPFDEIVADPDALPDARGAHVRRTAAAYVEAAQPLLMTASHVALVDPYFKLWRIDNSSGLRRGPSGFRSTLQELLREAAVHRKVEVFTLWMSEKEALKGSVTTEEFEREYEEVRKAASACSVSIEYGLLDSTRALQSHPRYLLGNFGGLHFDWGFDVDSRPGRTQHVEWMSRTTFDDAKKEFL